MPRTKQFNEEEILKKAMELFWERGFHATSIQNLVTCLGINRASLYDTFGGKEELFNKVFEHYRKQSSEEVRATFENENSVKAGFCRLFENAIEKAQLDQAQKGCFVVNTTTELIPGDEAIHDALRKNKENAENLFIEHIRKGIESGEIDASKDADSIGTMLFALFSGLQVMAKVDSDPIKLRKLVKSGLSVLD
ncbi:TetR/AcrR family transcriptional regulator [Allomuricauda sp. NBRC 101325]|uniref:TetR/AcrR family transcriptional regulator n=1 Tax=Allomuricauda sp. NBRC 101325 TaxID=1113758 RepID=UPI0024A50794|nr:TetR/AcrR family transcriptional regulator [Muricauda sp. NBRC 101325]GLU42948.1 TetR family transcriptional regulator [Muricauda sp. NBRC 101325]